ncbi:sugar phosphate isomerase/epimerase family protein [Planosporangium sp. 12N6]|uniref:sugar phosphate isomerase/epimerase family protein n=1 Tax=Planosporangium spinosum TaxID=3402278 RepID=UPI003CF83CCA
MTAQPTTAFRYGMSQFSTMRWSFEQDVENYPRLGVEALDLCEEKLADDHADDQLAMVGAAGLPVTSVQPTVRALFATATQPRPHDHGERLTRYRRSIERLARYTPDAAFIVTTGPAPGGDLAGLLDVVTLDLRELADVAAAHGVRIALEPLHPVLVNVETAIWTFRQAMRLVHEAGRDNLGVCVDLWNLWQDPYLIPGLRSAGNRIFVLQVSDWRTPRSFADRRSIGTGELPLPELLYAVRAAGFTGPSVLEILSRDVPDSLWEGDPRALVRRNRTALEEAWRAATALFA